MKNYLVELGTAMTRQLKKVRNWLDGPSWFSMQSSYSLWWFYLPLISPLMFILLIGSFIISPHAWKSTTYFVRRQKGSLNINYFWHREPNHLYPCGKIINKSPENQGGYTWNLPHWKRKIIPWVCIFYSNLNQFALYLLLKFPVLQFITSGPADGRNSLGMMSASCITSTIPSSQAHWSRKWWRFQALESSLTACPGQVLNIEIWPTVSSF